MEKGKSNACCAGACPKCCAGISLVAGIIILVNAFWLFARWEVLIGALLVILALAKLIKPICPHCK